MKSTQKRLGILMALAVVMTLGITSTAHADDRYWRAHEVHARRLASALCLCATAAALCLCAAAGVLPTAAAVTRHQFDPAAALQLSRIKRRNTCPFPCGRGIFVSNHKRIHCFNFFRLPPILTTWQTRN